MSNDRYEKIRKRQAKPAPMKQEVSFVPVWQE